VSDNKYDRLVARLDHGDDGGGMVRPTPGAAALDASINMDGSVRLALESDGQGVSVTLTMGEFIAFVTGGIQMWVQYYESGLMGRVTAGKSRRIIT
jgi:hypothetical protein